METHNRQIFFSLKIKQTGILCNKENNVIQHSGSEHFYVTLLFQIPTYWKYTATVWNGSPGTRTNTVENNVFFFPSKSMAKIIVLGSMGSHFMHMRVIFFTWLSFSFQLFFKRVKWKDLNPVDTGRKLSEPEDVLDVFWKSYVRSIYVLCLWERTLIIHWI